MVKGNNQIPNNHFKKDWQEYVKCWFNQPARKVSRRKARAAKAKSTFPRPVAGALRPAVHSQTTRYNMKVRSGRGFTLDELKEAGIPAKFAPTIGICVDHRRKNKSLESLQVNVQRLKAYKTKLILFPRNMKKPKAADSSAEDRATADQLVGPLMPTGAAPSTKPEFVAITDAMKKQKVYHMLRTERMNARLFGMRKKKAEEEAAKEAEAAKAAK